MTVAACLGTVEIQLITGRSAPMTSISLFLGSARPKRIKRSAQKKYKVMSGDIGMRTRFGWRCVLGHHLAERIVSTLRYK